MTLFVHAEGSSLLFHLVTSDKDMPLSVFACMGMSSSFLPTLQTHLLNIGLGLEDCFFNSGNISFPLLLLLLFLWKTLCIIYFDHVFPSPNSFHILPTSHPTQLYVPCLSLLKPKCCSKTKIKIHHLWIVQSFLLPPLLHRYLKFEEWAIMKTSH